MADTVREIERKYETADGGALPDLTGIPGVASVTDRGVVALDATYYDTEGEWLAADGITLRRRSGGDDAGWHLKLPVESGSTSQAESGQARDEIRAPLAEKVPRRLTSLVRSRIRERDLVPVVRIRTDRDLRLLEDAAGGLLAEVSLDTVVAQRLSGDGATVRWTEIEVELAAGADPGFLDVVERYVRDAGVRRATASSKLARALAETRPVVSGKERKAGKARGKKGARTPVRPKLTAGDHVLAYLRVQVAALVELDPAVRLEQPDSVHRMRVATRRLRSALTSYRKVLERSVTDPLGDELRWLAAELGIDRDREVLVAGLYEQLDALPRVLVVGPVRRRLRNWSNARHTDSRRHVTAVLDSSRYLALLDALDALLADPPLLPAAGRAPLAVLPRVVLRDADRLAARIEKAFTAPAGGERDRAMHEARKAAKRSRYAAEAAGPAVGKAAEKLVKRLKAVQTVLGEHQDSVVARGALRELAVQSHAAGDSAFTFGVLYGREEGRAAACENELPRVWRAVERRKRRSALLP